MLKQLLIALAYVAWKNREQLRSLWRNVTTPRQRATA